MVEYTMASKALHHMALDSSLIKKVGFDIDCLVSSFHAGSCETAPPVYIAGLARAGTTILLEALYSTGVFTTLTYRDMPFVTSPFLWSLITAGSRNKSEKKERAHQDGLFISFDSPEAFEEVFWMTFTDQRYVKEHHLDLINIDDEVIEKYRSFVNNVIARSQGSPSPRYLAKNNNNVLRIHHLKEAFPASAILVPFRNPCDHARSLHAQHQQFRKSQLQDPFSLQYMNWLGHFEFGENFRPFHVSSEIFPQYATEPDEVTYWLRYWKCVYEYLIDNHSRDVIFFDYDQFCQKPILSLRGLGEILSVDSSLLEPFCSQIKLSPNPAKVAFNQDIAGSIKEVYRTLQKLSFQATLS